MKIEWIIIPIIIFFIIMRVKSRGFFWRDRKGKKLSFKHFIKRYKDGVVNITPLQQTKTTLWSFIPIFAGVIWGIVVMAMGHKWWMVLILGGSLPITSVQFISNLQKYKAQKVASDMMKEMEEQNRIKKK